MTQKKSRVEELIKEASTVQNESLKTALEAHAKEEEAKQSKQLLQQFTRAKHYIDSAVQNLQDIRKQEKVAKAKVIALDAALEQFKKDGDYHKLSIVYDKYYYL